MLTVSVTQRSVHDILKQYDGTDIRWAEIEGILVKWGEYFRRGKTLYLDLSVNYDDRDGAGHMSGSSKRVEKRSARGATQVMRADLEAEQRATGQAAVWSHVYHLFECPLWSCNPGKYCWVDPISKIHRQLNTPMLKKLVKYARDGNTLDTHSDVPEELQEEIRSEERQRCDRKRTARAISPPSFHITNMIPGHAELPPQASQTKSRSFTPSPQTVSALDIPGFRDDAVRDYVEYLQGKVRNKKHQDEFDKVGKIVLDELLDLDQVYQENRPEFFTARDVKLAAAAQFIRDIPAFVKYRQAHGS